MLHAACPGDDELRALAEGREAAPGVAEHVAQCVLCRRKLDYLRAGPTQPSAASGTPSDPAAEASASVPAHLGRFLVVGLLGQDDELDVCYGVHALLQTEVLLAVARRPLAEEPSARQPLVAEAKRLVEFSHPHAARVLDLDVLDARPVLVVEHLTGSDLATHVGGRPAQPAAAVRLIAPLASAVAAMHDAGLVHGDLQPRHVIVDAKGVPRIAATGLARFRELLRGPTGLADNRHAAGDDLRALGELLFLALTGQRPPLSADGSADCRAARSQLEHQAVPKQLSALCLSALDPREGSGMDVRGWAAQLPEAAGAAMPLWAWWLIIAAAVVAASLVWWLARGAP